MAHIVRMANSTNSQAGQPQLEERETVFVLIVSFGRPGDVVRRVASVAASTSSNLEVIIVENAGPDVFDQLVLQLTNSRTVEVTCHEANHPLSTSVSFVNSTTGCISSAAQRTVGVHS
jgi:hypothetical protein